MLNWFKKRNMEKLTRIALSRLSDRELKDIGITRCDINNIATDWKAIQNAQ
jgi:uncharacterized protein YjiS (DUF1127 family)